MAKNSPARPGEQGDSDLARGPLPKEEFDWIFTRVPRLTVELVIATPQRGVLLQLRDAEPCQGTWSLPGGTVRFGEPVVRAVERVARGELGVEATVGTFLGYIEYPSHYMNGLDSPVGLAFATRIPDQLPAPPHCRWFTTFPDDMHDEQKAFLAAHLGLAA